MTFGPFAVDDTALFPATILVGAAAVGVAEELAFEYQVNPEAVPRPAASLNLSAPVLSTVTDILVAPPSALRKAA